MADKKEGGLVHHGVVDVAQLVVGAGFVVMFCRGGFVLGAVGVAADVWMWNRRHTKAEMPATR
ncbi:MAG: hypothetical protein WC841_04700 [Candidatus Shapirobacteria bacterium]